MTRRIATLVVLLYAVLAAADPQALSWFGLGFSVRVAPDRQRFLYIRGIAPDGPAAKAGIRIQDLVIRINEKPVSFRDDLAAIDYLARVKPGTRVKFTVLDSTNKTREVVVVPGAMSAEALLVWQQSRKKAEVARAAIEMQGKPRP